MRGGTENVAGIAGLGKAMEIGYERMKNDSNYIQGLKSYMIEKLQRELPGVEFIGDARGSSLYTVLSVMLPETDDAEMLLMKLDISGIAASAGSACTSGSSTPSHVLAAMGKNIPNRPVIRFSFSKYNTTTEIDYVVKTLKSLYAVKMVKS
jgi:cysteine desulfurase